MVLKLDQRNLWRSIFLKCPDGIESRVRPERGIDRRWEWLDQQHWIASSKHGDELKVRIYKDFRFLN